MKLVQNIHSTKSTTTTRAHFLACRKSLKHIGTQPCKWDGTRENPRDKREKEIKTMKISAPKLKRSGKLQEDMTRLTETS